MKHFILSIESFVEKDEEKGKDASGSEVDQRQQRMEASRRFEKLEVADLDLEAIGEMSGLFFVTLDE